MTEHWLHGFNYNVEEWDADGQHYDADDLTKAGGDVAYGRPSGSFIRQQTPPGSKARSTVPPSSCEISSSIRLVPNPACVGLATGGPPVSRHSTVKAPTLSPGGASQLIDTRPPALDSAPNFTALVASS